MLLAIEDNQVRKIENETDAPEAEIITVLPGKEEPVTVGDHLVFTEAVYRSHGVFRVVSETEDRFRVEALHDELTLEPLKVVPDDWRTSDLPMYVKLDKKVN